MEIVTLTGHRTQYAAFPHEQTVGAFTRRVGHVCRQCWPPEQRCRGVEPLPWADL